MIKDYKIIRKLGTGTFGIVYKVLKESSNKFYVIKQIPLCGMNSNEINNVKSEAKILSRINSSYVVKYHDSFVYNNSLNIVMEYCDGGDLEKFLTDRKKKKEKIDENLIWKIFIMISLGLGAIHKENILHRDLKTLNIFLTQKMDVKIGDLGVAKVLNDTNFALTFIGTPYYLSPEICLEKPYNDKSDVWALGCILYELCTFQHPFNARSQGALILKILKGNFEPVQGYSSELKHIVNIILEKDMKKRPSVKDILKMPIIINKARELNLYEKIMSLYGIPNSYDIQKSTDKKFIISKSSSNITLAKKIYKKAISSSSKNVEDTPSKIWKRKKCKILEIGTKDGDLSNKISKRANLKKNIIEISLKLKQCKSNIIINNKEKNVKKEIEDFEKKTKKLSYQNHLKFVGVKKKDFNFIEDSNNKIKNINSFIISPPKQGIIINAFDNKNLNSLMSSGECETQMESTDKKKNFSKELKEFTENLNCYVPKYRIINSVKRKTHKNLVEGRSDEKNKKIESSKKDLKISYNSDDNKSNIYLSSEYNALKNNSKKISMIKRVKSIKSSNDKLYNENSNSECESGSENVKEIKEFNCGDDKFSELDEKKKNILTEISYLKQKINSLKDELKQLLGIEDYETIMSLYTKAIKSNDSEDNYRQIEKFTSERYEKYKKDKFDSLYLLLISKDTQMNIKQNELKMDI